MSVNILNLKKSILDNNDLDADHLRTELLNRHLFYINLMSSPGSGKTSCLRRLYPFLSSRHTVGVLEADIDSDTDAALLQKQGIPAVQLHTGGMCHLDAEMSRQGIHFFQKETGLCPDILILENVGNLVCPAEFDTGAHLNLCILAVPEGDDKPLKYPLMFQVCDAVLVNKTDTTPAFDFSFEKAEEAIRSRNPDSRIFPVSAKTGEGFQEAAGWIESRLQESMSGQPR